MQAAHGSAVSAALRHPELIILDEATANVDTITEKLLDDIIKSLPKETTIVVIAHRLNTIEGADQILFVNSGTITPAGSLKDAVKMLEQAKQKTHLSPKHEVLPITYDCIYCSL